MNVHMKVHIYSEPKNTTSSHALEDEIGIKVRLHGRFLLRGADYLMMLL
jgi:hypothetical protein